jgi:hypothetical protein
VGRRTPKAVRREETVCRTHERAVHHVRGLSPAVMTAVIAVEHGRLSPGAVARALDRWEELASRGGVYRPGSELCGIPECCGPGPRGILADAIRYLPRRAKAGLGRVVRRVDEIYLSRTLPDPLANPGTPWWERRRPAGWPAVMSNWPNGRSR